MPRRTLPLTLVLALATAACNGTSPPKPAAESSTPSAATPSPTSPAVETVVAKSIVDELQDAKRENAKNEAMMLRGAAEMYIATKTTCPTSVEQLAEAKMISRAGKDPWGGAWTITCTDGGKTLSVTSSGADGKAGTEDDVVVAE